MIFKIEIPFEQGEKTLLQDIYIDSNHSPTKEDLLSVVSKFINTFKGHWQTIYFIIESCNEIPKVNRVNYYKSCDFVFNGKQVYLSILLVDVVIHKIENNKILN